MKGIFAIMFAKLFGDQLVALKEAFCKKIARIIACCLVGLFVLWMVGFALFFAALGLGTYLNEVLDSNYLGFFIITGICMALALIAQLILHLIRTR